MRIFMRGSVPDCAVQDANSPRAPCNFNAMQADESASEPRELVICGARVFGVEGSDAVFLRGDRIEAVGSRKGMRALAGKSALVIDRPRALICPGLHDAHVHLGHLGAARMELDLHGMNPGQVRDAVAERVDQGSRELSRFVIGRGFDPEIFRGAGVSARALLDEASPARPVLLRSHDYHAVALNTVALQRTGFLPHTPQIDGGVVDRDGAGELTGILREMSAFHASVQSNDVTDAELAHGVLRSIVSLHKAGITAVHDMSGTRHLDILRSLDDANSLPIEVFATVSPGDVADQSLRRVGATLRIVGMKAFLDGALGSRTARLLEPYEGETCHCGVEVLPHEQAAAAVRAAADAGLPSYLHAIGDRAVRTALDVLQSHGHPTPGDGEQRVAPSRRLRHRVEHAQMIHPLDLPRFADLGIAASMQPVHMALDAPLIGKHWGARASEAFPLRSLLQSGARLAFGSDAPIETFDVFEGIACATQRRGRDGTALAADEAISVADALTAYTSGAAWCVGAEHELGSIRRGGLANLTLISEDIAAPGGEAALGSATIDATIVRGIFAFVTPGVL